MLQYRQGRESTNTLLVKNLLPVILKKKLIPKIYIEKTDPKNITKLNKMEWHPHVIKISR